MNYAEEKQEFREKMREKFTRHIEQFINRQLWSHYILYAVKDFNQFIMKYFCGSWKGILNAIILIAASANWITKIMNKIFDTNFRFHAK